MQTRRRRPLTDRVVDLLFAITAAERKAAPHHCGAPGDKPDAFPVDSPARARAALSLAHNSSDPAHVRACVARVVKEEGWNVDVTMAVGDTEGTGDPDAAADASEPFDDDERSFDETRATLQTALAPADPLGPTPWITDVYPSSVVYTIHSRDGGTAPTTYRRSYQIDPDTQAVGLGDPVAVRPRQAYDPVAMTATFSGAALPAAGAASPPATSPAGGAVPAGWVERTGTLFRVAYPDKRFTFTEADADRLAAEAAPVPLEVEHTRSVFDGHLGQLVRFWRDGDRIMTTAHLPAWADAVWAASGRKISAAFDRATKMPLRAGLVLEPRVADAALMAAFTGARHSTADLADMQAMHDLTVRQGATCAPAMPANTYSQQGDPPMDKALADWLKTAPAGTTAAAITAALTEAPATFAAPNPTEAALLARITALEGAAHTAAAQAEVNGWLHADLITPAQFDGLVAALARDLADDAATPVQFAVAGKPGTRADALRAAVTAGAPRGLRSQGTPSAILFAETAMPGSDEAQDLDAAEADARAFAAKANRAGKAGPFTAPPAPLATAPAANGHS